MKKSLFLFLGIFLLLISCEEENVIKQEPDTINKIKIAETLIDGINVELYSDLNKLYVGYNNVYLKFRKDGSFIKVNLNKLTPVMDMGAMTHQTPYEVLNDSGVILEDSSRIDLNIVYIMPSTEGSFWYFDLDFEYQGKQYKTNLKFDVYDDENLQMFKYNNQTYFVSMISPRNPYKAKLGMNDFIFSVYKKESGTSFPAVTDLETIVTPWMPDMNHGSYNTENPFHQGKGVYYGKVNFLMTGYWTVTSEFFLQETKIGEVTHTFTF